MEILHDCLVCRELKGSPKTNCANEKCKYYICEGCIEIIKNFNKGRFKCLHGCDNKNSTNVFIFEFNDLPREILMHWTIAASCFFQLMFAILFVVFVFIAISLPFSKYYDLTTTKLN